jgi:carbon-monoxide dehydrogenase large subunit
MESGMKRGGIGDAVRRKEDARLVTGAGHFADDLAFPDAARAFFVRSPHGHARIGTIDVADACAMPGVLAVLTGADAQADGLRSIPQGTGGSKVGSDVPLVQADGSERLTTPFPALAVDVARHIGQPVAMVIARSLEQAQAAAEKVLVDWEPLPAVTHAREALEPGAPQLWEHVPGNLTLDAEIGDAAGTARAFEKAAHRVAFRTRIQRVTGVHMEPRVCVGQWDATSGRYTVHASHGIGIVQMQSDLALCLNVPQDIIRCVAPGDVGGNFGTRNATYPEFPLVAWAARKLGVDVKHVAERGEAFLTDYQGRDLTVDVELALDAEGNFLALRTSNLSNLGAHTASFVALNKGLQLMTGVYRFPVAHYRARAALTNTPSTIPYRSAGRPEAMYIIERLVDLAAQQCGLVQSGGRDL